ncbi:hypothetical protein ACFRCW_40650 [Streptomyces sp. NPDC056653]|uniref:hypothetical protein n=1 Tax=Streptomyces sp. NPDC056653 TaxID=3345894 RepID=UPI0036BC9773
MAAVQAEWIAQGPQHRSVNVQLDVITHEAQGAHAPAHQQPERVIQVNGFHKLML